MPGFRKKDEEANELDQEEQDYERMFPKIGRDFVYWDDLEDILAPILNALPGVNIDFAKVRAIAKANEYKDNLSKGQTKRKKYKDLVDLED